MPASAILFIFTVLAGASLLLAMIGLIWKIRGRHTVDILIPGIVIFIFTTPFLFWPRTAMYNGILTDGDKSLGWPVSYIFAQSDAGVFGFTPTWFLVDLMIGVIIGSVFCIWKGYFPRRYKAEQDAATNP